MSDTDPYMAPEVEVARFDVASVSVEPEVVETPVVQEAVPEGSIKDVLAWVGDDVDKAKRALAAETEGENRKTLVTKLKELTD